MIGGEFLPDLEENEVEIVRINLESVTNDQISIRAKWVNKLNYYSVVDEYLDDDMEFIPAISKSKLPLTYGEMIYLIEETAFVGHAYDFAGLIRSTWLANYDVHGIAPPDQDRDFITIESDFYPLLNDYYQAVFDEYVREFEENKI
ncbi:hypothetical protein [Rhodohalobacter sulfatireducens]|uniref:Uncharacterized protein n=1 Tax=Rhodohalobacter sulfatireducens TaxID=2911366 RepID=A0ABS9KAC6_9BACT|nr:hypothetical protein [Rhodohalobacter sulfatireducens]MCG2587778.1 hypothetical protein [Rhodohalobacter sulfatireducens]